MTPTIDGKCFVKPFPNTIAVIPIRAGSKGLPGKNIQLLAGKPLFMHAVDQARDAGVGHIVISTDIPDIFSIDLGADISVHARPTHLASDTASMSDVLSDLLTQPMFDAAQIVLLQATSPLRTYEDVCAGIDCFALSSFDIVMSVYEAERSVLKYGTIENGTYVPMRTAAHVFSNRQDLPQVFRPNGAVYVFNANWYRRNGGLETSNIGAFTMSAENSIDVDTKSDLERCEIILTSRLEQS